MPRARDDGTVATRLLLISDTHVPARARRLPDDVWRAIDDADVVVHAGDWVDVATLDAIEARAARLVGVAGNNDGPELHARLGEFARSEACGVRFGVVHETGACHGMFYSGGKPLNIGGGMTCSLSEKKGPSGRYSLVVSQPPNQAAYEVEFSGNDAATVYDDSGVRLYSMNRR